MFKIPETKEVAAVNKNETKVTKKPDVPPTEIPKVTPAPFNLNLPASRIASTSLVSADKVPSNWHITPGEDNQITAKNNITNNIFTGTTKEFSAMLRDAS